MIVCHGWVCICMYVCVWCIDGGEDASGFEDCCRIVNEYSAIFRVVLNDTLEFVLGLKANWVLEFYAGSVSQAVQLNHIVFILQNRFIFFPRNIKWFPIERFHIENVNDLNMEDHTIEFGQWVWLTEGRKRLEHTHTHSLPNDIIVREMRTYIAEMATCRMTG